MKNMQSLIQAGALEIPVQSNDVRVAGGDRLLVTSREAARLLSVCERTLFTLTKAGEIPVLRIGRAVRYSLDDLREWIRRQRKKNL